VVGGAGKEKTGNSKILFEKWKIVAELS